MSFAGKIAAVVDDCCGEDPDLWAEFRRRRLHDWRRMDVQHDAPPAEMLVDFVTYMLDVDGEPVYFDGPFFVVAMLCADVDPAVRYAIDRATFGAEVTRLRAAPRPTLDDWFAMLSAQIVDNR